MSTKRMDEQAVTAFMELFFSDNPPVCEAVCLTGSDVGGTKIAARFGGPPEPDSAVAAVYKWLEKTLGLWEPRALYEGLRSAGRAARAHGVTIDLGTKLMVLVDEGHLMCPNLGDWVVYVTGAGFSVMPDVVFRDVWESLQ